MDLVANNKRVTVPPTFHPLLSLLNVIDFESESAKTSHTHNTHTQRDLCPPRNSIAPLIEVPGSALLGNQILHRRSGIISIHVTHPRLYKCLQVHVIANARLVRFVLVRLSPNWPNTNETVVNGRCQQEMWKHTPRFLFHRECVQTRS